MHTQLRKKKSFTNRRRSKIWVNLMFLGFFIAGLALFSIGWLLPQLGDLISPIGIEIIGGAIMFYLIDQLWQHPNDENNSHRMEEILERLEVHRNIEEKHIEDSASQLENLEKKVADSKVQRQKTVPVRLSWFLAGIFVGMLGILWAMLKGR